MSRSVTVMCTVELHFSGLIRTASHMDMQIIRITGYFFKKEGTLVVWSLAAIIYTTYLSLSGPGSSVGKATDYGMDGPGIESRWGEIFRRPDRPWGPPSLLYNGNRVFSGGRMRPGRDADPSSPFSAEV